MRSFLHSLASIGCARGVFVAGACGLFAAAMLAPRWNQIPVDFEDTGTPAPDANANQKGAVERLLAERSNLSAEQRHRVARAIVEESLDAKLDPVFVLAVMDVESELDRDAISNRGAKGLMQVKDTTALYLSEMEQMGLGTGEIGDPALNVRVGVRYLRRLHRAFGDLSLALVAYNAGPHRLSMLMKQDPRVPEQFLGYPRKIGATYHRLLAQVDGGSLRVAHPLHLRLAAR